MSDGSDTPAKRQMAAIRAERRYAHADEVACSAAAMGDAFPAKCAAFFEEHLHEDEEIRYVRGGKDGDRRVGRGGLSLCGTLSGILPCKDALLRSICRPFFCVVFWVCACTSQFEPVPGMVSLFVECSNCVLCMFLALSCCFFAALSAPFRDLFFFSCSVLLAIAAATTSVPPPLTSPTGCCVPQVHPRGRRLL